MVRNATLKKTTFLIKIFDRKFQFYRAGNHFDLICIRCTGIMGVKL